MHREGIEENILRDEPIDFEYAQAALKKRRDEAWGFIKNTVSSIEKQEG